jgi:anti-sigma B factor antagonist
MSFELSAGVTDSQLVLVFRGDLDAAGATRAFAAVAALEVLGRRVIVDLAGLDFIDCFALRALLELRRLAQRTGGDVLLAAPAQPVQRLLTVTGMASQFRIYATVAAAVHGAGSIPARQL